MKSKVLSSIAVSLVIAGCVNYTYSKTIPSGLSFVINDFLKEEESMPFVHEIVKTCRLSQTIFHECESYGKQREFYQTKSLENQSVNVEKDYYASLSIVPQDSQEEIKSAYKDALKKVEGDKEDDIAKRKEIQEAYDVLGEPFKKSHYDLERDIAQFIAEHKKILFDDRIEFLEILYESRSFIDSIFSIILDKIHSDGSTPIMTQFIEMPILDKEFFTKNIINLDQLYKVSLELTEFSIALKNTFSATVKKNFNLWIRKQKQ